MQARPVVCGALGGYDPERARRLAACFDVPLRTVHEDGRSLLMLDREPLRWAGSRQAGLAWIEGLPWRGGAGSWQEAARQGACGLVLEGRRRYLHSSVNGLASLYWLQEGGGAYFASRIDPLVRIATAPLSIDWDAWASILLLRFPAAGRTPFAEIRRLEPFSLLQSRLKRFRSHSPAWPWAQVEVRLDRETAAEAIVAGLREEVAALPGPAAIPLSGGRDSRMVACVLAEAGKASGALSVGDDEGDTREEDLAEPVAAALDLPHERLGGELGDYPAEWEERARLVEHQFVDHAWLVPLARRLEGADLRIADGFAIDSLFQRGDRFYLPETLDHRHPHRSSMALFDSMRRYGLAHLALADRFRQPLIDRAYELFRSAVRRYDGNASQATLAFYRTRTAGGIARYPSDLLGARAEIFAPGASDSVATASLAATAQAREGDALYPAVFELLNPQVGRLPSTSDTERKPPHLPRRWCSPAAVEAYRQGLADGPLAQDLSLQLREWMAAPQQALSTDLRLGMEGVALFHSWWRRYRDRLHEVDPVNLII